MNDLLSLSYLIKTNNIYFFQMKDICHFVITAYTKFVSANTLCYCPKVCQSQRQLLLVVTSLNIHNPHVYNTHSHCCRNVFTLFTWLHVSGTLGKSSAIALICHYIFPFSLFVFFSHFFYFIAQLYNIYWSQKCDQYWLETFPILTSALVQYRHNSWILSTHGSLISDVVPNLCWK